jgi:hypothetical protein
MSFTAVIIFLVAYVLPAAIAGLLQWADYKDTGPERFDTKEKIIKLYLIPMIPIGNWFVIIFALVEYLD